MLEYQERYLDAVSDSQVIHVIECSYRICIKYDKSGYVGQESLFFHSLAVAGFIGNGLAVMIFCTEHCLG